MGREVRKVHPDWKHPVEGGAYRDGSTRYKSLFDGSQYTPAVEQWDEESAKWLEGFRSDYNGGWKPLDGTEESTTYEEWAGPRPDINDYMPQWNETEATHFMMYETCSEGSPISPAFATPEEVARWCADNGASAFGSETASYEAWLRVANGGYACSAVSIPGVGLVSGVEGLSSYKE